MKKMYNSIKSMVADLRHQYDLIDYTLVGLKCVGVIGVLILLMILIGNVFPILLWILLGAVFIIAIACFIGFAVRELS